MTASVIEQVRDDEYQHLQPVLETYAATGPNDPSHGQLRERLIAGFLPVATHIARRYAHRGEPVEDLTQVATIGLINAIDRYQPELGHHFLGYAIPTITGEVRRYFRDRAWSMRVPRKLKDHILLINAVMPELSTRLGRAARPSEIAVHLRLSADEVLDALEASQAYRATSLDALLNTDSEAGTLADLLGEPDANLELVAYTRTLAPLLAGLQPRERSILIMRFFQDMTQTQIGVQIGVSQMQVSRLLSRTLAKLRTEMDAD